MVQVQLEAVAGEPFDAPFFTTQVFPRNRMLGFVPPPDLGMHMSLTTASGTEYEFVFGKGLCEGRQPDGTAVVVFAIHDPIELGYGEHTFHVTATGATGETVLDQTGTLTVVPNPDGVEHSPGRPTWFDAFYPVLYPEQNVAPDVLPPPEVGVAVRDERLAICKECPFFNAETGECSECGCYMPLKTGLLSASCPIGKWGVPHA
jgi:hypothetical protein